MVGRVGARILAQLGDRKASRLVVDPPGALRRGRHLVAKRPIDGSVWAMQRAGHGERRAEVFEPHREDDLVVAVEKELRIGGRSDARKVSATGASAAAMSRLNVVPAPRRATTS